MPVNGAIARWDEIELYVSSSGSGSHTGIGTGTYTHGADADAKSAPDTVDLDTALRLQVSGNSTTDQYSVTYTGPGAPSGTTWTGSGWASVNAKITITDLVLYNNGAWLLTGTLNVYVNGVKQTSIGSSGDVALSEAGLYLSPVGIPLLGCPWGFSGGVTAGTTGLGTLPDEYDYCSEATGSHSAGWRFKEVGGAWVDLPISLAPGSAGTISGGCTDPGVGTISGSDTYVATITSYSQDCHSRASFDTGEITECITTCTCPDGSIQVYNEPQVPPVEWEVFKKEVEIFDRSASVRLVPNLERAMKRFNTDYSALWYRDELPATAANAAWSCDNNGVLTSGSDNSTIHALQSVYLELVTNSIGVIEGPLNAQGYSPWTAGGSWSKTVEYEYIREEMVICAESECPAPMPGEPPASCEDEQVGDWEVIPNESYDASRSYTFPSSVGTDIATYLEHDVALARYINSWCNPHWSYFLFTDDWEVDSAPELWNDYWELVGSQWQYNVALSDTPGLETRNHIVSEPLDQGGMNGFLDTYCAGQRWLGVSRWQTKAVTPRTSYTYDSGSSTLWESADGTLSFAAGGVTLTP